MAEITMGDNHRAQFARWQHAGEWLAAERTRLEAELRYVAGALARLDSEVTAFVARAYGLDTAYSPVTLDSERGILVTPSTDAPAAQQPIQSNPAPLESAEVNAGPGAQVESNSGWRTEAGVCQP